MLQTSPRARSGKLEGAEIETRQASEEVARVLLLEKNIPEIIPPKIYIPHLKREAQKFYKRFREIHNLKGIQRNEVELSISNILEWLGRTVERIRRTDREDWLKQGTSAHGAHTELNNAQDCLERGNLDSAILQARYSALLSISPVLSLLQGLRKSASPISTRYYELLQSRHPYSGIVTSVMKFSLDKRRLEDHTEILRIIAKRYE